MKAKTKGGLLVLGLLATLTAEAVPNALVEMVQAPAWIERADQRLPLVAGMELQNRDRVVTGDAARVVVQFADGSAFRIGEKSLVAVNAMQQGKNGRFAGGIDLKAGDLQLISHEYAEAPVKRAINVRFGEVTAAVRSEVDLAGSADTEQDAVLLRDGRAVLAHPQAEQPTLMEVPLQVYRAAKGQAPQPVTTVDRFQGATWGLRSQPYYDGGTQEKAGRWWLSFGIFDKDSALPLYDRLRQAGYAAKLLPKSAAGGHRYELRLMNLVTEREAISLAERLADNLQLPVAAVSFRR